MPNATKLNPNIFKDAISVILVLAGMIFILSAVSVIFTQPEEKVLSELYATAGLILWVIFYLFNRPLHGSGKTPEPIPKPIPEPLPNFPPEPQVFVIVLGGPDQYKRIFIDQIPLALLNRIVGLGNKTPNQLSAECYGHWKYRGVDQIFDTPKPYMYNDCILISNSHFETYDDALNYVADFNKKITELYPEANFSPLISAALLRRVL
jgi:hypothetical protein